MSDSEQEQGKWVCAPETKQFWIGFSLPMLVGLSAINIFVLFFVVPKFEQIFADALPGKPLPGATEFIITYRIALVFVALGWPIVAALLRKWQKPYAILWINLGIIWFLLEVGITIIALFMPMVGGTTGMSDAHP